MKDDPGKTDKRQRNRGKREHGTEKKFKCLKYKNQIQRELMEPKKRTQDELHTWKPNFKKH